MKGPKVLTGCECQSIECGDWRGTTLAREGWKFYISLNVES